MTRVRLKAGQVWFIHTVDYYSAVKMSEVLTHATMWMNLENVMLSEGSQSVKATEHMTLFL